MRPSGEDVDYLLERGQRVLRHRRSAASDLTGAFAGVRPLISTGDPKKSVDISRKAELYETSSGMITITGGKLTTWRRMAKMTVDRLVERDARDAPLPHARDPARPGGRRRGAAARGGRAPRGLRGARRRATATPRREVLAIAAERGELAAADRRRAARPARRGRAAPPAASRRASIGDVLLRRTRLGLLAARELTGDGTGGGETGDRPVSRVGDVLARELGWDATRLAARAASASRRRPPPRGSRAGAHVQARSGPLRPATAP